jgi:hypothetical protein
MSEAKALPSGPVQVELFAEAIRIADSHALDERSFELREDALWPAYDGGRPDLLMVYYAWCLAYADRRPEQYLRRVLWAYRWVASSMVAFPTMTRQQIDDAADDMARRYRAAGYSLRPVYVMRRLTAKEMGDREAARLAHEQIDRHPRDEMCDDPHLERAFLGSYLLFTGDFKQAVAAVEPILTDRQVGHDLAFQKRTQSKYLVALARLGRIDFARAIQKAAYPVVKSIPRYLHVVGEQLEFLAVVGDFAEAVRIVEKHLPEAAVATSLANRFTVYRAARLLVDRLRIAGQPTALRLSPDLLPGSPAQPWTPNELAGKLDTELDRLAEMFDRRNGNGYHREQVAELADLNKLAERIVRLGKKR